MTGFHKVEMMVLTLLCIAYGEEVHLLNNRIGDRRGLIPLPLDELCTETVYCPSSIYVVEAIIAGTNTDDVALTALVSRSYTRSM